MKTVSEIQSEILEKYALQLKPYAAAGFNKKQLVQIGYGFLDGLDVTIFAHLYYTDRQMRQIRAGLIKKVDVSYFMDPCLCEKEMKKRRLELQKR